MRIALVVIAIAVIYFIFFRKKESKIDSYDGPLSDERILPKHKVTINKDLAIR